MKKLTQLQRDTLDVIIRHPKSNPITGKNVANRIGLKERDTGKEGADMRSIINALRKKGYPICAGGRGYYYADHWSEVIEYAQSLKGRIEKMEESVAGLRESKHNVGVQEEGLPVKSWEEKEEEHTRRLLSM